ncbi:MAG: hypothetical protein HY738_03725 [Bacteroidia bacterium]|nr:hypothetical protein [Bacteroidia bacterium]
MNIGTLQISLSYDQLLDLIKQLPIREKVRLSQELAKETIDTRLSRLLNSFKTDELSLDTITEEVEKVRSELYVNRKGK